jgi:IS5 family transposase
MKVHAGVDKDSGLIHSVVVTAANVHELTPYPPWHEWVRDLGQLGEGIGHLAL